MIESSRSTVSRTYFSVPLILTILVLGCSHSTRQAASQQQPRGVVPAEFEPQAALLLAWPRKAASSSVIGLDERHKDLDRPYAEIVEAVWESITPVVLVEDSRTQEHVVQILEERRVPLDRVRFFRIPFESHWIRDFGPMGLCNDDGTVGLVDAEFVDGFVGVYPHEDRLPSALGRLLRMSVLPAALTIHHGNLLSNGRGLFLATHSVLTDNAGRGYDEARVRRVLHTSYGAEKVVFLEAMKGEPTGHVDMFATFASPKTVVVGAYSALYDQENAAILDRNAKKLEAVEAPYGPLDVVRVPMPPRIATPLGVELWPTYTNVAYANEILLVPVFDGWDPEGEGMAFSVYHRICPSRKIVGIRAVPLLLLGGGVHCVTLNIPLLRNGDSSLPQPDGRSEGSNGAGLPESQAGMGKAHDQSHEE